VTARVVDDVVALAVDGCPTCALHAEQVTQARSRISELEVKRARSELTVPLEVYGDRLDAQRTRLTRWTGVLVDHLTVVHEVPVPSVSTPAGGSNPAPEPSPSAGVVPPTTPTERTPS